MAINSAWGLHLKINICQTVKANAWCVRGGGFREYLHVLVEKL